MDPDSARSLMTHLRANRLEARHVSHRCLPKGNIWERRVRRERERQREICSVCWAL